MNKELLEDTRRFLRELNSLLIHIAVYLIANISLVIFTFTNFKNNWWALFPIVFWSLLLIYHAVQMADRKNTTVRKMLSGFFVSS